MDYYAACRIAAIPRKHDAASRTEAIRVIEAELERTKITATRRICLQHLRSLKDTPWT